MTTLATTKPQTPFKATGNQPNEFSILDPASCNHLWQLSQALATSDMIPAHFRGKPANVFIGLQIAARGGLDPFGVLQNIYVIGGKPAFETKLALALLNVSGRIRGPIEYSFTGKGKDRSCTATVVDAATGRKLSDELHWATVEMEGWLNRSGSKWKSDPLLMMKYRTAMRLIRTHYPEVLLGMLTIDEASESAAADPKYLDSAEMYRAANTKDLSSMTTLDILDAQIVEDTGEITAEEEQEILAAEAEANG